MGGILVLGAFFVSERSTVAQENVDGSIVSSAPERSYIEEADKNNDGTPDWQEVLTAQVIDTIKLPSSTPEGVGLAYEKPTTFTGKFSEAFFTDYLGGRMNSETLGENDKKALVESAVRSIESNTASKVYTMSEILLVPDSEDALHAYGNQMVEIVNRHSIKNELETSILKRALEQNDPAILNDLAPIRQVYERVLSDSLAVPVPQSVAVAHTNIMTAYAGVLNDISGMEQAFSDPLLALASLQKYEKDMNYLYENIKKTVTILISNNVFYEKDEPGAFIYTII